MNQINNFITFKKNDYTTDELIDLIKKLKNTFFICNHLNEFFHPFNDEQLYNLNFFLKENNSFFYTMVSCDEIEESKFSNFLLLYFPTYLLKKSYFDSKNEAYNKIKNYEIKFESLFLFLNSNPKPHRYIAIDYLSKHNLLSKGNYSWLKKYYYTDYKLKYWNETISIIDFQNIDKSDHIKTFWNPVTYGNPFLKLVGETLFSNDNFYLTEKTSMPILLGQPFLTISNIFFYKNLQKLGFKLYDEIFEYEFDNESDGEKRIEMIINNIKNIENKNYYELYDKIQNKVKFNQILALQMISNDFIYNNKKTFDFVEKHKKVFQEMLMENKITDYTFSHGILDEKK
jgi:hypothetical protein